jgi:UDP-glucose 4-epimerase
VTILVVGGAGYIGSVTVEYLLKAGYDVVVLDNLSRGHRQSVPTQAKFSQGDMGNARDLSFVFENYSVDAVMHFSAHSLVGESIEHPSLYFNNNIVNGVKLLDAMLKYGVKNFVFSSTCAVYGEPEVSPILESSPLKPVNPYGESKLAFEKALYWYSKAYGMRYAALRYFNAAGASNALGEDHDPETHLIPLLLQIAIGKRQELTIFGDDYPTKDGTCVRDYIHVLDLADAHERALKHIESTGENVIFNLGTGKGFSVKQVVDVARKTTGHPLPTRVGPRRAGDPSVLVASNELVTRELGWRPHRSDLETIIADAWRWHKTHPLGYATG